MPETEIVIRGAREHNLQNVSLSLPRNKLIVMTGVSGSGKSSLAFDTLYAEGQRRYVESLSTYARQFLGQLPKPNVDSISGLAPSISIQQKSTSRNPRSTVGTITEIFDYLRVLFARVGQGYCYVSGKPIKAQSTDSIIESIASLPEGTRYSILAPIVQNQKGEFKDLFEDLLKRGHLRARVDGDVVSLNDDLKLRRHHKHTIEVVIDRLVAGPGNRSRLAETVEAALKLGDGRLICAPELGAGSPTAPAAAGQSKADATNPVKSSKKTKSIAKVPPGGGDLQADRLYSAHYACAESGMSYEPPSPQLFSFNSPLGMCMDCHGLGMRHGFAQSSVVVDEKKSIQNGALLFLKSLKKIGRWPRHFLVSAAEAIEKIVGMDAGTLLKSKWKDLPEQAQHLWLYGTGDKHITFSWKTRGGVYKHGGTWEGWVNRLLEQYRSVKNPMLRRAMEKHLEVMPCPSCEGERLNKQARHVKLTSNSARNGKRPLELSLPQVCALSIEEASEFFGSLKLDATQQMIAEEALKEIRGRLGFLLQCGLHYLSLERSAPTLSGGESQRIRLAGQIGCGLVGVVYILDEPSIGLHPRDNVMLLESLQHLRDQGNTVIVVEHDEETMRAADHVVDFGPGPGVRGGELVVEGSVKDLLKNKRSLTGQYLSGRLQIEVPETRRGMKATARQSATSRSQDKTESAANGSSVSNAKHSITVKNARHNNLKGIDVSFPLGRFICVTGVSGSGKSSITNDILWQVLNRDVNKGKGEPGKHDRINGLTKIDKAIDIDQSPIGRTPRSNPATYVKVFDEIRKLFTALPQSKMRGYKPGRFSFNVAGGRCEACEGHGATKLEMDFLADIWVPCDVCEGRRFSHETLEVKYKDHSVAEILNMEIRDALELFENVPKIRNLLQTLVDVGLDYMQLGQPSPTLSGGEAQRIKLARELGKRSTGQTLYLLDEPTTGLHFADVHKLLEVLHGFVDRGNTVIVVEHNLDVIKTADWVIDIGPEGGAGGGEIVVEGTPEEVARCRKSHTGTALRSVLGLKPLKGAAKNNKAAGPQTDPFIFSKRIQISGASQHNLQHIDMEVPRGEMSVFCGPSGSGKTSLAMDTLYAEGQRRYVESLSAYARQFLGQMPKPRVDSIQGLSPAIAIEQKTVGATPRSTVGTVTEIYDYLRVLYARLGVVHCPTCGKEATKQTTDEIVEAVLRLGGKDKDGKRKSRKNAGSVRAMLLAPITVDRQTPYEAAFERLQKNGFARVRVDGVTHSLESPPDIDHRREHEVEVVVDRIVVDSKQRGRITDSVEAALDVGKGVIRVVVADTATDEAQWEDHVFSLHLSCLDCGYSYDHPTPQQFSFNSPLGWCWSCEGLGTEYGANQSLLVTSPERSLWDGAIGAWPNPQTNAAFGMLLQAIGKEFAIPLDEPWYLLTPEQQRVILYGNEDRWIKVDADGPAAPAPASKLKADDTNSVMRTEEGESAPEVPSGSRGLQFRYRGLFPTIELAARLSFSHRRSLLEMAGEKDCSVCNGTRLQELTAAVQLKHTTLPQLCKMPLAKALEFLKSLKLTKAQKQIAGDLLNESVHRLTFLVDVGLDYLTMNRSMPTLSGGESQRIRLAGQVGRSLTGVLYVLDEPTIGLHPRDNGRLLAALKRLRDLGNTVLLVEHDREVLEAADRLFDFGPGAGRLGGNVVAEGTPKQLGRQAKKSLTGGYLSGEQGIPVPEVRRMESISAGGPAAPAAANGSKAADTKRRKQAKKKDPAPQMLSGERGLHWLSLHGATQHNLRSVDLNIPLGTFTCITGVSGSGKSSLIMNTLAPAVARKLNLNTDAPGPHRELLGIEHLSKIVIVDQNPIGNTPASNPATYTGLFDHIRDLFTRMPEAKVRGFGPGRFSFNRAGGRCDDCEGMGQQKIEMHFLPDVWVECTTCQGRRYNDETLNVKFNGHSIADVLDMPVEKALEVFSNVPKIRAPLATLNAIGLGYLTLGQSAPTLSGGEAQRIKLAAELAKPNQGRSLYLLDEPTTGLHFDDIAKLLAVLNSLVEQGNTVVVIEHNLDVIKTADWIVDIGPEAGAGGGMIVAEGTPEDVAGAGGSTAPAAANGSKAATVGRSGRSKKGQSADEVPSDRRNLQSWTGKLLGPVLTDGTRGTIKVFDVKEASKKQAGDVSVAQLGKSAALPWEAEGQKWHTKECLSHDGKRCQWDGEALQFVIDQLAKNKRLAPVNWNHRSTVEVKAKGGLGWLLHARTGHAWVLVLCFRVKKGTFDARSLDASLNLTPIDDVEDIHYYTQSERVSVRNLKSPWQEVTIKIWNKAEVETPQFRQFLEQAVEGHLLQAKKEKANPADLTPWKQLGRKWHLMKKGLPKKPTWDFKTVEKLLPIVEKSFANCEPDFSAKSKITWKDSNGKPAAELHTKRKDGVDLVLHVPNGTVTIGAIADFGVKQEVKPGKDNRDAVLMRFDSDNQIEQPLQRWLAQA
ncbi:excinuclease ABC subunit UvrA [Fuerstiella marisgermanici]|uniref:UvrABC system protein A n=1 Tax=Fuerstiella marisgermanici TaxID=1891926 RepID=A0A1P8WKH5_9PLAN|nr:excinuclease ABC subunit UvrA [Fuerstiella marisgermanici]APZ94557.1 Excinuclease ABC subunit A [Fuerstiella marisgermanici]